MPPLSELAHSFELSSYRENLFEQIFCAELLQACWLVSEQTVEIARPFVDFQGYDLVASRGRVTRHIQLKSTPGRIAIHRAMAEKPSACVVNLEVQATEPRISFQYRYLGEAPGVRMSIDGLLPAHKAMHSRDAVGGFQKAERARHVVVPARRFTKPMPIIDLVHKLFG